MKYVWDWKTASHFSATYFIARYGQAFQTNASVMRLVREGIGIGRG
jgi:hypothetical protein